MEAVRKIGENTLEYIRKFGSFCIFVGKVFKTTFTPRWYPLSIFEQMLKIGFFSIPVVTMTAIFTGGALALQTYAGVSRFSAESTVPTVVVLGITRELGPVLVALMVTGRVTASIAAELGTMRVTEQIDALKTLSTNPFRYLIAPRIIAGTITMPILTLMADVIAIMGGYIASVYSLGFAPIPYLQKTFSYLEFMDVASGLIKACAFGFIITLMGCYFGYTSKGGAEGVGKATTAAVVFASIMILTVNYLMTQLFFI